MNDIIQLLPDAVANQIAAGEVVQRPASVVKELLENSIDAGATEIKLIVKDAGKQSLQVIDNGKGMTETDARMAFERHATSKIRKAEDLFEIKSMGFRGEALASIAAVAQVELKTRQEDADLGSEIRIEGSKVVHQGYCQSAAGTIITVKNLFYNIPARRNFLKGTTIEYKHILDEFERVALANPAVSFELYNETSPVFQLTGGNLRQRIVGIFGRKYDERLVPVNESTDVVSLKGFVIKPEFSRKTRGEQFFFVNNRFVRNHYLHHAINEAFEGLLSADMYPGYFLFLDIPPDRIDVNIHPTKTEIKFDDERAIYAIVRVSAKHALGQYNVAPSLDFDREQAITAPPMKLGQPIAAPTIEVNPNFNPFLPETKIPKPVYGGTSAYVKPNRNQPWESFFEVPEIVKQQKLEIPSDFSMDEEADDSSPLFQLMNTYLVKRSKTGLLLIHQQRAHERVLYERFRKSLDNNSAASQQLLFPQQINLPGGDMVLLTEYLDDLRQLGFDIEPFGQNMLVIQGIPLALQESESVQAIEKILEGIKHNNEEYKLNKNHHLAKMLAKHGAITTGKVLSPQEMLHLADQLFACQVAHYSPDGTPAVVVLSKNELEKFF